MMTHFYFSLPIFFISFADLLLSSLMIQHGRTYAYSSLILLPWELVLTEVYLSGSSIPEPDLDFEILGLELDDILHEPLGVPRGR